MYFRAHRDLDSAKRQGRTAVKATAYMLALALGFADFFVLASLESNAEFKPLPDQPGTAIQASAIIAAKPPTLPVVPPPKPKPYSRTGLLAAAARIEASCALLNASEKRTNTELLDAFISSDRNRLSTKRKVIYILPDKSISDRTRTALADLIPFLEIVFSVPIFLLDDISPSPQVHSKKKKNALDVDALLKHQVAPKLPADAFSSIVITDSDLVRGSKSYVVLGLASMNRRTCACSTARFSFPYVPDCSYAVFLERLMKLTSHELGHTFGLRHCRKYECVMNQTTGLAEHDKNPLAFCPACLMCICYATKRDPMEMARELSDYCTARGLHEEATRFLIMMCMLHE